MNQLFLFSTLLYSTALFSQTLTMDSYIDSVKKNNEAFQAAEKTVESSTTKILEADLLTMPQVFSSFMHVDDKKPRATPAVNGTGLTNDSLSFGLQQQNRWGTSGKIYYTFEHTQVKGLPAIYSSAAESYTGAPAFELKQSLWRNGFGSETKATETLAQSSQKATALVKKFELKGLIIQAEAAYQQLALSRETVRIQKDALARSQKIRDWNAKRVNMGLADKADLLQAEAGLQLKTLDLKNAIDDEKTAARNFNSLRSIDSEVVVETVKEVGDADLDLPVYFKKVEEREDLAAMRFSKELALANAKLGEEKIQPSLDLVASASFNSLEKEQAQAVTQSLKSDYPFWTLGVNFSAPLDVFTTNKLRGAYDADAMSADLNFKRKKFETEKELQDLMKSLEDAKARLELTKKMEKLQQEKLSYEKERLFKGKTVTYQVLQFEIDFANSQLMRLREEARIIGILASLKTYRSEK